MFNFDFNIILEYLPMLIKGVKITLFISVISSFFAFIIGLITVYLRKSEMNVLKFISSTYVELVRNTPLLIQLYIWYKGLPNFGITLPAITCGILALSIYTGAFISEVLRSGINSIASQQVEAARSLGLNHIQTFRLIILPQAIKIVIPPLGSQFINLIKNSSLVSFIAVQDIFYVIYKGAVDDFRFLEFFLVGGLLYMFLTGIVAVITNVLEHKTKIPGRLVGI